MCGDLRRDRVCRWSDLFEPELPLMQHLRDRVLRAYLHDLRRELPYLHDLLAELCDL